MFRRRPKRPAKGQVLDGVEQSLANNANMELTVSPMLKSFKKYAESQKGVDAAEQKFSLVLEQSDREGDSESEPIRQFMATSQKLHELGQSQSMLTQGYIIDPVKNFSKIFHTTADCISSHKRAAQNLKRAREKVEKYRSRGAAVDPEKLDKAIRHKEEAEEQDRVTGELVLKDVPTVYTMRIDYMQPCMLAVVSNQICFLEKTAEAIASEVPEGRYMLEKDSATFETETKQMISEMRKISIVGGY